MKKNLAIVIAITIMAALLASCAPQNAGQPIGEESTTIPSSTGQSSKKQVVNVYNWGEYIDESIFADFEKQTGIKVNYQTFDSNESLYTVLKGGGADYDVIIPSDYMISRLIAENMLEKLDYANIPNIANIDAKYRSQSFDPSDEYSVPYTWGTVGIIYDPRVVTEPVTSWGALFDAKYSGQILMFDNPRDAMGIALQYLGYSLNTTDETELNAAFEKLQAQKPFLQAYVMDQIFAKLESGEAAIGPYYSGDYITMLENNPNLEFCLPDEGSNLFIDAMCIPKGAKNKANAEAFINFMCSTEVALANADATGYGTPSKTAFEELDPEVRGNEVQYPSDEVLGRCEVFLNLPDATLEWYNNMWGKLKS